MTLAQLISSAQFLVDEDGQTKAVQLDIVVWQEILALLEDLEDVEELEQAIQEEDEVIPWEQVKTDYLTAHPNV